MRCSANGKPLARGIAMQDAPALPPFAAIVVAAGKGLRAGQPLPKQFAQWNGKPVLRHSVEALLDAGATPLVVVIPDNGEAATEDALKGLEGWQSVTGGATRQQSVANGLAKIEATDCVLIHDAARPLLPREVIERLLDALGDHPGAIPVLPVIDSLAIDEGGVMAGSGER